MPPRVVGDTNFWVAAAGRTGSAHRLYQALLAGHFAHITSTEILAEITRVLRYLPNFTERMAYDWYCDIGTHSELVTTQSSALERITISRDPDDNKFLECAVGGRAEYIITRDNDLLALDRFRDIRIIPPDDLWTIIQQG